MAIGSVNQHWGKTHDVDSLEWFPRVEETSDVLQHGYYELPNDIVLVPFHPVSSATNPHLLLWEDAFSIFMLLDIFGLPKEKLLLVRYTPPESGQPSQNTCTSHSANSTSDESELPSFLPALLGIDQASRPGTGYVSTDELVLAAEMSNTQSLERSSLICASRAVAGMGMLCNDGGSTKDPIQKYNHGRAACHVEFTKFLSKNLGLSDPNKNRQVLPIKVACALDSSQENQRSNRSNLEDLCAKIKQHTKEMLSLKTQGATDTVVESYAMGNLSLPEHARIGMESAVLIAHYGGRGGGLAPSFLSQGSSLIVLYSNTADERTSPAELSSKRDWESLRSASHLRVHWFSLGRILNDDSAFLELIDLIQHELALIKRERQFQYP